MIKKLNIISFIVGIVCFLIAGYIVYDEFFVDDETLVNFNEDEELVLLNDRLSEIGSPLGKIVIVDGISNQDDNGKYNITYGGDLFDNYSYRQLFVMEYILSNSNNNELFTMLDIDGNVIDDLLTSEFILVYLEYNQFNSYYKSMFGEDFDVNKAQKGNTTYDETHVYYDNRRVGSNGVYVSMIQASEVEYSDGVYTSNVTITYSTRASELVGASMDNAKLKYTKDINGNIILKSFVIEGR